MLNVTDDNFRERQKNKVEELLIAAQKKRIRTNYVKLKIDKDKKNNKCRLRGE